MYDTTTTAEERPRAMLVAIRWNADRDDESRELLDELIELTSTVGADVADHTIIRMDKPNSRYLIGSGNAEAIVQACREHNADLLIFDESLTPAQQRNWEKLAQMQVIDRHGLILEIFAKRAHTREAVLQIELARAEYAMPRLKNAWTHLSRQQGGVGVRGGEGEKQIEVDGRMIRRQIDKLKAELVLVRKRRAEQRKRRQALPIPSAAIVGYTNAGKSSLLNALTKADVLVEDKLFATLDPTTRRIVLPDSQLLLLTDTVGFVRKLPHDLVDAFKSTLEEAVQAHFLLHVVDAGSAAAEHHMRTTLDVLEEIGAGGKDIITVFNKIDLIPEPYLLKRMRRAHPDASFVSIHTGEGLDELTARLSDRLSNQLLDGHLLLPHDRYDLMAMLHRTSRVVSEVYEPEGIYVHAAMPGKVSNALTDYIVRTPAIVPDITAVLPDPA